MFRILEVNNTASARPAEVGGGYVTREDALAAIKRHLERFVVSGHNPEGSYWWARDSDGLRKCWIAGHSTSST